MKKLSVFLFVIAVMTALPSQAQLIKFGVKGGLNVTKIKMSNEVPDGDNRMGFFIGPSVLVNVPLTGLDIEASTLYDYRSSKFGSDVIGTSETLKQQQVAIPINVRYGIGLGNTARVFGFAGPQFGFAIDKEQSIKQVADWKLKTSNFSVNVGVGAMVLNHVQATVNYNIPCGNTGELTVRNTGERVAKGKSNTWQIGVAYYF